MTAHATSLKADAVLGAWQQAAAPVCF
jgi:hypothetical protein